MKTLSGIAFLFIIMTALPAIGSGTVMVCSYSTGAEIVVDLNKENKDTISIERLSPQKIVKHKIFIKSQSSPSETDDYIEVESKGKSITYPLKCKKQ